MTLKKSTQEILDKLIETYIIRLVLKITEKYGEENLDDFLEKFQKGVNDFKEKYKDLAIENINHEEVFTDLIESISNALQDRIPDFPELALDVWAEYLGDISRI
jgi:lysophospholipase L1-like esterase